MAALAMPGGLEPVASAPVDTGNSSSNDDYLAHLLDILTAISEQPSPSYFPPAVRDRTSSSQSDAGASDDAAAQRPHPRLPALPTGKLARERSPAERKVEEAIMALGERALYAEGKMEYRSGPAPTAGAKAYAKGDGNTGADGIRGIDSGVQHLAMGNHAPQRTQPQDMLVAHAQRSYLLTPDVTPPVTEPPLAPNHPCPTCRRTSAPPPFASANGDAGADGDTMSAEKELELLKAQVSDIARVCKAVAVGDLTQKIVVPVRGQTMVELKGRCRAGREMHPRLMLDRTGTDIINAMVDQLKTCVGP